MTNEEIQIYPKLWKLMLLSVMFTLTGLLLIYVGLIEGDKKTLFVFVPIGIICTLFFGICLVYIIRRMAKKEPFIVINDQGIQDRSSMISCGEIAWKDIQNITLYKMMNQKFIGLELTDPDQYLSTVSGMKKLAMKFNKSSVNAPVNISGTGLKVPIEDVYAMICEKWKAAKHRS